MPGVAHPGLTHEGQGDPMPAFTDADEVYDYIGGIFRAGVDDAEIGPKFAASGVVLRLNHTEPDSQLLIDMPNRKVFVGDEVGDTKATVTMFMTCDVAHRFWLGDVNVSTALAKGDMRAKGPIPKILKLVPIARSLFPRYRERLEADGRADLLAY